MKIIRKIISVLLVFTMVFSTFCLSVFANDNVEVSYIKVPQAKFTSSGVVRVAKSVNSFEHGNTIVAATPSGVPKIDNSAIANTAYAGEDFLEAPYQYISGYQGAYINNYFENHPEMVLGTASMEGGMYRGDNLTYKAFTDRGSLADQIREAFKNIQGKMEYY